ncbi:radical SAM protein [Bradyrhizobium sp. NAS96.2]|nr:radical SAM protein [Bradyrhizobium sp. NAS96.2]
MLVVDGSRIHRVNHKVAELLAFAATSGRQELIDDIFNAIGVSARSVVGNEPPLQIPVRAFSLAIAQKCNLGCTYCYAEGGDFGARPKIMPDDVAVAAAQRLFDGAAPGDTVRLAFLGGEPLMNRTGLRRVTDLAEKIAQSRNINISFSLTTNGTLLTEDDAEFLARHGFTVTVSLDGVGEFHDRLRPFRNGSGSFNKIVARLHPLFERQDRISLSARVTVTPYNLSLLDTLHALATLGFRSVGFSPVLSSPTGRGEMTGDDLALMLDQMIACGRDFEDHLLSGRFHPFANLATALRELHRGTHRPYPCGAGASYLGVSAEGELAACHRFVNEPEAAFGNVRSGLDQERQTGWLAERHVDRQEPCKSCWARYLCGGGCHHEVIHRGRPACDYIRSWLTYCLETYLRLEHDCRWWFDGKIAPNG